MEKKRTKSILTIDSIILVGAVLITFINVLVGSIIFWIYLIYKAFKHKDLIFGLLGNFAYSKKNYDKALKWYKKAALSNSSKAKIIKSYILVELKEGSLERAKNVFNKIIKSRTFYGHDLYNIKITESLIMWKEKRINDSIDILEKLLKDGENLSIYETLGYMLIANKDYLKALDINNKALEYEPSPVILANLGEIYYKLDKKDKSFEIFKSLIDENVNFSEPFFYCGLILKEKGNLSEAKAMFEKALSFPESFLSTLNLETIKKELSSLDINNTLILNNN
ncbi:tetratricopeptide repeat protein [Clostridium fallax]|uniref:Tetratricopeptide repeat-containing protein n=1 Tax=Clostridium fallax TaxID=1533 RepID=A0A1M4WVN3_9CLOT|nr:tetratricopeptide repeat protein [Clostridium fallax]SHE85217.1 Tetratricopeptide repeat-containing protein [Clostridium fallax]SQB07428.1 TPR repeat-containing protein [Clostridium fallax]